MKPFVYHENPAGKGSFSKIGDAWALNEKLKIYAVADSPLRCLVRDTKEYPFDDYGYCAATTFCESFIKYTEAFVKDQKLQSINSFKEILLKCNQNIKELNDKLGKEYNDENNYDLAETVGMGAIIINNTLYYGGVEDCYVNVLRGEELKNVAEWREQIEKASKYIDVLSEENRLKEHIPEELKGKLKEENQWEPCWCNYLRNNPQAKNEQGSLIGWGCFTGEEEVSTFIQTYSLKLEKGDQILLFSDGMIPVLRNSEFCNWLLKNRSNSFYFQLEMREKIQSYLKDTQDKDKEKTLILLTY